VDRAARRIYLDPALIAHALSSAPERYTLHSRNPANDIIIGGEYCAVMPAGGPP
jgi:trimethylamine--corrinoid protein Co-methyltransferase